MTTPRQVCERIDALGLRLWLADGTLKSNGPLPDDLVTMLATARRSLIAFFDAVARWEKGAQILWEMEQAGQAGTEQYEKYFTRWVGLDSKARAIYDYGLPEPKEEAA